MDEDWGQLDYYGNTIPVKWPCVLINFNNGNFTNISRNNNLLSPNRQQGLSSIEIVVANLKTTNTSFNAPKTQKWHGFEIWEILQEVHNHLHGFRPSERSGVLSRTNYNRVRRDDGVQEIRINYSLSLHAC